jgi:hypothetical protein
MMALKITADGWLHPTDVNPSRIADVIGCTRLDSRRMHFGIEMWHDADHASAGRQANMHAVCLMINCGDETPDTVPIIDGDVLLLGVDANGNRIALTRDQMHALGEAVLSSLAA